MPTRRTFLGLFSSLAWPFLHRETLATSPTPTHHLIHATTLNFWRIVNPAQWCLEHKYEPILERAYDGLRNLSMNDEDRIRKRVLLRKTTQE